jgi:homopolymeric O-antigen transport system permease protein
MTTLIIDADRSELQYWSDLWRYRDLFFFLAWRDLLVRYKQTVVGVSWSLIRPFLTMLILTVVFGKLGKMPSGGIPYPLLVLSGMLPWVFFSTAISDSGNSLVSNSSLISKVYFPRLIMAVSSVMASFVDFLISALFMVGLMFWYRFLPPLAVLLLPLFTLLALAASVGVGLWISALMVKYRDFRIIVPFIVQFGLYLSPVGFQSSVVPDRFRLLYSLNPMVGIIDGFRWSLLGARNHLNVTALVISIVEVTAILVSGVLYFRKTERTFADLI